MCQPLLLFQAILLNEQSHEVFLVYEANRRVLIKGNNPKQLPINLWVKRSDKYWTG